MPASSFSWPHCRQAGFFIFSSGIGKGERLKVIFPGAGWDIKGPIEHRAEVLPMMALLFPDAMTAALMREVERMANDPVPIKEQDARIAALTDEIEQLAYVEEALVGYRHRRRRCCRSGSRRQ